MTNYQCQIVLNRRKRSERRETRSLGSLFAPVQFVLFVLVFWCNPVSAQCYIDPVTGRQVCPLNRGNGALASPSNPPNAQASAHCRISLASGMLGSGTLVGRNESVGLVLTCAHLFDSCPSQIVVSFPGSGQFAAQLVA